MGRIAVAFSTWLRSSSVLKNPASFGPGKREAKNPGKCRPLSHRSSCQDEDETVERDKNRTFLDPIAYLFVLVLSRGAMVQSLSVRCLSLFISV